MALDFFEYTTDIRQFAPQVKTDTKIEEFKAYERPQKQKIIRLIGKETYDLLKTEYDGNSTNPVYVEGIEYLQAAMANMMAIPYFKFDAQERNNTDNNLFRYQENAQIEEYLENYWTELDNLLELLEKYPTEYPDYQNTDSFKLRETLYLKNGFDFQKYYGSNAYKSAYFYNSTVFLQQEVQKDELDSRFPDWIQSTEENELYLIGKIIAYGVMKQVCIQFDYTEMPKPLRGSVMSDIDTRKSKGDKEETIQMRLANEFDSIMRKYMLELENQLNEERNDGTFEVPSNLNTSNDKFYLTM